MECVHGSLNPASVNDMTALKSSPRLCEFWSSNVQNYDVFVDELLDFSNEDGFVEEEPDGEEEFKDSLSKKHPHGHETSHQSSTSSPKDDFWSVSSRDFEDLEWLSHLVADSLQEYSAPVPSEDPNNRDETHPVVKIGVTSSHLTTPFPSKPRSKRARICPRFWSLGSPLLFHAPSSLITSPSSCSSASSAAKKPKKKPTAEGLAGVQSPRRCSHCGVQKTPQWRAGPLGAKSLCNACGVRFKSGRLFPEYRPACSPTFSSELHSNHHRKVLEMRRKKETKQFAGVTQPAVPSF